MGWLIQQLLDYFYYIRRYCTSALTFLTLRIYGLEVSFKDVKDGSYASRKHSNLHLDDAQDLESLLAMARESNAGAAKRRLTITEKCKTLLTLGSLLLGVIGLLLPKYLGFDQIGFRVVGFIAIVLLFNAIATLLMFFDIGAEMEVSLSQSDVSLSGDELKRSLLNRYLQCYVATENRTDYLADMYKAARFCFMSAFVLVAALVSISLLSNTSTSTAEKLVIELRSDPSLVNLLKGPKGNRGEKGSPGKDGRIGPQGAKGEKGDQAVFDYEMFVIRLLSDPKFKSAVEKVLRKQTNQPTNP